MPGGVLLTRPCAGGGATPMLPKNGRSGMVAPMNEAVIAFRSIWMMVGPRPETQFSRTNPLQPL